MPSSRLTYCGAAPRNAQTKYKNSALPPPSPPIRPAPHFPVYANMAVSGGIPLLAHTLPCLPSFHVQPANGVESSNESMFNVCLTSKNQGYACELTMGNLQLCFHSLFLGLCSTQTSRFRCPVMVGFSRSFHYFEDKDIFSTSNSISAPDSPACLCPSDANRVKNT